jgi:hypothetical protein
MARLRDIHGAGRLYAEECTCKCVEQTVAGSRQEVVRQSVCWMSDKFLFTSKKDRKVYTMFSRYVADNNILHALSGLMHIYLRYATNTGCNHIATSKRISDP